MDIDIFGRGTQMSYSFLVQVLNGDYLAVQHSLSVHSLTRTNKKRNERQIILCSKLLYQPIIGRHMEFRRYFFGFLALVMQIILYMILISYGIFNTNKMNLGI